MRISFFKNGKPNLPLHPSGAEEKEEILRLSGRLFELFKAIDASCKNSEAAFLHLGETLQEIHGEAAQLTGIVLQVADQISAISMQGILSDIKPIVAHSLQKFFTCREEVHASLKSADEILAHLAALGDIRKRVESISKYFYAISLNMIVESTRSRETEDRFNTIGYEIKALSTKVNLFSTQIRKASQRSDALIHSFCNTVSDELVSLNSLADNASQNLQESIHKAEQLLSFSHSIYEQAVTHSQSVSRQVGEIVMGVQLHDSVGQRIGHIGTSLNDAGALCLEAAAAAPLHEKDMEKLGQARLIVNLQAAQLRQIINDLDSVYQNTVAAFGNIADEMAALSSGLIEIDEINGKYPANPFTDLNQIFTQIQTLLSNGDDLTVKLQKVPEHISTTATHLTAQFQQVKGISQETENKALNAMISTLSLGVEGKTLHILAQEMKSISIESKKLITNVLNVLESIAAEAKHMESRHHEYKTQRETGGNRHEAIETVIQRINRIHAEFSGKSQSVLNLFRTLTEKISRTTSALSFLQAFSSELKQPLCQLEALARLLTPWESHETASFRAAEKITQRYTMHKERLIHNSMTASPSDFSGVTQKTYAGDVGPKADDSSDLGDNVELF